MASHPQRDVHADRLLILHEAKRFGRVLCVSRPCDLLCWPKRAQQTFQEFVLHRCCNAADAGQQLFRRFLGGRRHRCRSGSTCLPRCSSAGGCQRWRRHGGYRAPWRKSCLGLWGSTWVWKGRWDIWWSRRSTVRPWRHARSGCISVWRPRQGPLARHAKRWPGTCSNICASVMQEQTRVHSAEEL